MCPFIAAVSWALVAPGGEDGLRQADVPLSAFPERRQFTRPGVEQGALAVPDGVDDHQVAVPTVQCHRILPPPQQQPVRRAEQPAVQVADKQDTVRDRRKAPGEFLW